MLSTAFLLAASMVVGQADDGGATADDYLESVEYYVGTWNATTKRGDEVTHSTVSVEWSPTKRAQVGKITQDGQVTRHALWGFDATRKRWCGLSFNADGSHDFGIHGPEMLQAKYGKSFKTRLKGAKADGSPLSGMWTTTLVDEKTYEVKIHEFEGDKRRLLFEIRLEKQDE